MTDEQKKNNRLLNKLIIYMGFSDDLIFWVLTDILFLSTVKGFSDVQISMFFTVGFWGSLLLSYPYFRLIKKLKLQTGMVINEILFLAASLMLLLSQSIVLMMIAQCLYCIALDTFSIGDVLVHDLCRKSEGRRDFVKCRSQRATLYGVLSLIFALMVYSLMKVNASLPMIIQTGLTVCSLVLVLIIAKESKERVPFQKDSQTVSNKKTKFNNLTWTYILLAVFTSAFLALFLTNSKILLNDDATTLYGAERAVEIFSSIIIATRVAKIIGNSIPPLIRKKVKKYQGVAVAVVAVLLIAMSLTLLSFSYPQASAILVGISIVVVYLVFDPLCSITKYLFINGLSEQQELSAIFTVNMSGNILQAVISSIITIILVKGTMLGVMQLIALFAIISLIISIIGLCIYRRLHKTSK